MINSRNNMHNPFFELFILQVRIIDKLFKIYATISKNIKNFNHIKISLHLCKDNNLRNLRQFQIDLYLNEKNNIEPNKIITLTSQEVFNNTDRIVVNPQKYSEYETKVLNNNNKFLDSKENEKMINNGEIFDLSKNPSGYSIINYIIESVSEGCDFNLISQNSINQNIKQEITLNFINNEDSYNNNIQINCILSNDYNNKIPCSLNKEINNNFSFDSYIGSNNEGFFLIIQDEKVENFHLNCQKNKQKESNSKNKIILIIVICIIGAIIIIAIIFILIFFCRKKEINLMNNKIHMKMTESQENISGNN